MELGSSPSRRRRHTNLFVGVMTSILVETLIATFPCFMMSFTRSFYFSFFFLYGTPRLGEFLELLLWSLKVRRRAHLKTHLPHPQGQQCSGWCPPSLLPRDGVQGVGPGDLGGTLSLCPGVIDTVSQMFLLFKSYQMYFSLLW